MKKIIISILTFLFSICMLVPLAVNAATVDDVYDKIDNEGTKMDYDIWNYINNELMPEIQANGGGASQESVDHLQESVDSIDVKKDMTEFYDSKNTGQEYNNNDDIPSHSNSLMDKLINVIEDFWAKVPEAIIGIANNNTLNVTLNPRDYNGGELYGIFQIIGYSLVLLFFAVNLIENTIKYEIFTLKGGAQLFGRLIISKAVIDLSGKICIYILDICDNISKSIINAGADKLKLSVPNIATQAKNGTWIVGEIIDFIQAYNMLIPVLIILLAMIVVAAIILVKLILRSIELSLLVIISPTFFACYSSETTKPYFKNFILTFIQCAVQIIFISVVFHLSADWLYDINDVNSKLEAWKWFLTMLPKVLIALAIAIMMVKPPKVLTNLIK